MKPNILLIVWDTVRYDHLSYYGYERPTTPFLNSIAGELVSFENAVAQAPWTLPAHTSIFTGLYPSQHGMVSISDYLPENVSVLAEILAKAGYQTAGFSQNLFISPTSGLHRGYETFLGPDRLQAKKLQRRSLPLRIVSKALRSLKLTAKDWGRIWPSARTVTAVQDWLTYSWQARFPFFAFINFMDAHWRLLPPPEFRNGCGLVKSGSGKEMASYTAIASQISSSQIQEWLCLYDASIRHLDYQFERLFTFLANRKLLEDTVVIIVSDHGEHYGEHDLFGHRLCLYDEVSHVPLLIRFPDSRLRGLVHRPAVEILDLFPTLLEMAQTKGATPSQGKSLLTQLNQPDEDRVVFAESFPIEPRYLEMLLNLNPQYDALWLLQAQKSIRSSRYKLIWSGSGRHQFYDLQQDPREKDNLIKAGLPQQKQLKLQLENWMKQLDRRVGPTKSHQPVVDKAVRQRLVDLGYIE